MRTRACRSPRRPRPTHASTPEEHRVDDRPELVVCRRALDLPLAHEQCGRHLHATALADLHFITHYLRVTTRVHTGGERRAKPEGVTHTFQIVLGERAAILTGLRRVEAVVEFPELALLVRAFGRLGRPLRLGAEEREVPEDELHLSLRDVGGEKLRLGGARELAAGRTLEVRPLFD